MRFRSARNKVARAKELTKEVAQLLDANPPYNFCLETDTRACRKVTKSYVNEDALDVLVTRCGEIVHNLRSALDHAYWEAVSPHVGESTKAIQFPVANNSSTLEQTIKSRLAHKVSAEFYSAIKEVRPYRGRTGNIILCLIHDINIEDKHKFPITVGNLTELSSERLNRLIPDFPRNIKFVDSSLSGTGSLVAWESSFFHPYFIGDVIAPTTYLFCKDLNIPIDAVISVPGLNIKIPVIKALEEMAKEVEHILAKMSESLN